MSEAAWEMTDGAIDYANSQSYSDDTDLTPDWYDDKVAEDDQSD